MNPGKINVHSHVASIFFFVAIASCTGLPSTPSVIQLEAAQPFCSDPDVLAQLLETANTHPNFSPGFPSPARSIDLVVETQAYDIPDIGSGTFRRICIGEMTLQSGEVVDIGWEIFTTDTVLGPAYGITPCFGRYDTTGRDCTELAEGRLPGEVILTPQPAQ